MSRDKEEGEKQWQEEESNHNFDVYQPYQTYKIKNLNNKLLKKKTLNWI